MGKDARGIWLLSAPVDFRDVTSDLGKRMAVENGGVHDVLHAVNEFFISIVPQKIREIFVSGVIRVYMTFFSVILKDEHCPAFRKLLL
jgi:hypothetical protein|nr:MAG TPA: hypothetical protein [Bacteriophage sp.]